MHIKRRRGWELPECEATPEHLFFDRRAFIAATGAAVVTMSPAAALAQRVTDVPDPTADLYPAKKNPTYKLDRAVTEESINTTYNNFYEFGSSKSISRTAQALVTRPWTIKIDGMVEKPQEVGIDDLIRKMMVEERLYRHRCVAAWGMAIRLPSSSPSPSRPRRPNMCGWRRSSTATWRAASARAGIRGPMWKAAPWRRP
jgi:methionine sulfoxide reductase catalytic subunit